MQTTESDVLLGLSEYSCNLGPLEREGNYALPWESNIANSKYEIPAVLQENNKEMAFFH